MPLLNLTSAKLVTDYNQSEAAQGGTCSCATAFAHADVPPAQSRPTSLSAWLSTSSGSTGPSQAGQQRGARAQEQLAWPQESVHAMALRGSALAAAWAWVLGGWHQEAGAWTRSRRPFSRHSKRRVVRRVGQYVSAPWSRQLAALVPPFQTLTMVPLWTRSLHGCALQATLERK